MKLLLLIDFDGTMYNTSIQKDELKKFFSKYYNLTAENFDLTYESAKHKNKAYSLFNHLKQFGVEDKDQIKRNFLEFNMNIDYNFPDFKRFYANVVQDSNIDFYVYTNGYKDFQHLKLNSLQLNPKPKVIATLSGKKELLKKYLTKIASSFGQKVLFKGTIYDKVINVDDKSEYFDENLKDLVDYYLIDRIGSSMKPLLSSDERLKTTQKNLFYKVINNFDELWKQINKFQH